MAIVEQPACLRFSQFCQNFIGAFHAHTTEIRNKAHAISMARELALSALARLALANWQHVTAVTTPVCAYI